MPVRKDRWRPTDRIYDGILARLVADAESDERRYSTGELMAAAVVLVVLAVAIITVAGSGAIALLVCGVLGAGVFAFVISNSAGRGDRGAALRALGGPGRLPSGYLVHPWAWEAGMAEHVAHLPESQLRAAADMCHLFPGTLDDLLVFVGNIAIHVPPPRMPATPDDVERRAELITRVGLPLLVKYAETATPLPTPPTVGKRTRGNGRR
jgi:hypothetical protein